MIRPGFSEITTNWPVDRAKQTGHYFYDAPIAEYLSDTEVMVRGKGRMLMFGGYSYLSLHRHPKIQQRAVEALQHFGIGGYGVRLLAGTTTMHKDLENTISTFIGTEDAILYSSGFMANISAISALVGREDTIYSDRLNHASIHQGCLLSRARLLRFKHGDMDHLQKLLQQNTSGKRLVITEGVFSMDGDIAPLPDLVNLCKEWRMMQQKTMYKIFE